MQQFQHYASVALNQLVPNEKYDETAGEVVDKRRKSVHLPGIYFSDCMKDRNILRACFQPLHQQFHKDFPNHQTMGFEEFFDELNCRESTVINGKRTLNKWKIRKLYSKDDVVKNTAAVPESLWKLDGGTYVFCFSHIKFVWFFLSPQKLCG